MKALHLAAQSIACGDAQVVIAGGQENMSAAPHVLPRSRAGQKMGEWPLTDSMIKDGLWCAFNGYHMGTALCGELAAPFDPDVGQLSEVEREQRPRGGVSNQ